MVSKKKPIDVNSKKYSSLGNKKNLSLGNIISICDVYYPLSYWYIYDINEFTVTLIGLDNCYKPFIDNPKVIQIEIRLINYNIITTETKVVIDQTYLHYFYQNRITLNKKPRYGDMLLIETQYDSFSTLYPIPFFVLNYDPLSGSHLLFEISYSKLDFYKKHNENLILELCNYTIIFNKEIRRDIIEKCKKIKYSLENSNYAELTRFDEFIRFNAQMNYISEKIQLNEVKLIDLDFLTNEKLDCLEIEKEYNEPVNNYNYWETNTIINYNNDENYINTLINYCETNTNYDNLYDYDKNNNENYINTLINYNNLYDFQQNNYNNLYNFEQNNDEHKDIYPYRNVNLIQLYDSDNEIDLKNSETFDYYEMDNSNWLDGASFDSSIEELIEVKTETETETETEPETTQEVKVETETETETETIQEVETETETIQEVKVEKETETETIQEVKTETETIQEAEVETETEPIQEVEVETVNSSVMEIEEFEHLEANDFEPYYKESGCSVM